MDIYYWKDYGDEGRKKYAVYEEVNDNEFVEFFGERRKKPARHGDMHRGNSFDEEFHDDSILLSQNMVEKMKNTLLEFGTLTLVNIKDRDDSVYHYYITNELDCINYEKSTNQYEHPALIPNRPKKIGVFDLIKPVLDEDKYNGSMIFKVIAFSCNNEPFGSEVFVTKDFIDLVEQFKLKGFKFYRCHPAYKSADKECEKAYKFG